MHMKKLMMFAAMLAAVGMVAGCFTSATAYTETKHADGSVTVSRVNVIGTGDKASEIAADGLFADGTQEDLGAGVKTASATQQSTGVKETLEGMGVLLGGLGSLMARSQVLSVPAGAAAAERGYTYDTAPSYDTAPTGYTGSPGDTGIGVYGQSGCGRCAAYAAAHPDIAIIDIADARNRAAMWDALRTRGYTGNSVALPVAVTADGYTQSAK
jgi:hypothetical protein